MRFGRRTREASNEARAAKTIAELTASRRAIVDAYEVERRRIERDLHDGAQQYLVAAAMKVGEASISPAVTEDPQLKGLLDDASSAIAKGLEALRATVRGIHPQILSEQGLEVALRDVAQNAASPVKVVCPNPLPELPEGVLAAAYFFACEAVANAAKHAPQANVTVLLAADSNLHVSVMDDGPGGAKLLGGHGLVGMRERLAAFGGLLSVSSPVGGPTQVAALIPLLLHRGEPGVKLP